MRKDKLQAVKLRKQGYSYNEIGDRLKVPKSTLSYWLAGIEISQKAKKRLASRVFEGSVKGLINRNRNQTKLAKERAAKIRSLAKKEFSILKKDKLFLVGISLYWAEGYKKGAQGSKWKAIDFTNSDPKMVVIMVRFFKKFLKIKEDKIKVQLIAHKNVDIEKSVTYWSSLTNIPQDQFIKTCCSVSKSSQGKRDEDSLTHGTVHIRINDVKLFFKVIGWIDGLKSDYS
ncbi:MAG: helix-turn-helix domain-containing protein [Parcubacteria group bacterium]